MNINICEIYKTIQGEGRYVGIPALFIRVGKCNLNCWFCDSKYYENYKSVDCKNIIKKIEESGLNTCVWTGGEPTLYIKQIEYIRKKVSSNIAFHIETNGSLQDIEQLNNIFSYICVSPKREEDAKYWSRYIDKSNIDIKVVTDIDNVFRHLIKYATMLMPLTLLDSMQTETIKKKVWNYCIKHKIRYCPRLHIDIFGINKRRV